MISKTKYLENFFNFSEKLTDSIVEAIKKVTKTEPELSTSGGTSDARFISKKFVLLLSLVLLARQCIKLMKIFL